MGKSARARRARATARPADPAPAPPSRFILDGPRDLGFMVAAPLWVIPAVLALGALVTDRVANTWIMAFGATGHHLPGMLRAYGDRALFRRFRARFILAPLALVAATVAFVKWDVHALVYIAFVWGVWHGMMQTYGFARIYAAKAGMADRTSARADLALLATWFAAGVLFSPQRLAFLLEGIAQSGAPLPNASMIQGIQWTALAATATATLAWLVRAAQNWRAGRRPDPLHLALLAGSIAFWCYANVRIRHPMLGMPLFELFHDAQYLAIVWAFNRRRVATGGAELAPPLRAMFQPRAVAVLVYLGAVVAYGAIALPHLEGGAGDLLTGIVAASQLLHFYYDGFIWKVREPATGAALGVAAAATPPPPVRRFHHLGWGLLAAAGALLAYGETHGGLTFRQRLPLVSALVPHNTILGFSAAELHWERGERTAALDGFRHVLALDPSYAPARDNLAISLEELIEGAARDGDGAKVAAIAGELRELRPRLSGDVAQMADRQLARYAP
jgi:hypothetical protein